MKLLVALIVGMILGSYAIGFAQIGGGAVGGSGITITNVPGGSNTQVQFNDSNSFGGDAGLVYNKTTDTLTVVNTNSTHLFGVGVTACTAGLTAAVTLTTNDTGEVVFTRGSCS